MTINRFIVDSKELQLTAMKIDSYAVDGCIRLPYFKTVDFNVDKAIIEELLGHIDIGYTFKEFAANVDVEYNDLLLMWLDATVKYCDTIECCYIDLATQLFWIDDSMNDDDVDIVWLTYEAEQIQAKIDSLYDGHIL